LDGSGVTPVVTDGDCDWSTAGAATGCSAERRMSDTEDRCEHDAGRDTPGIASRLPEVFDSGPWRHAVKWVEHRHRRRTGPRIWFGRVACAIAGPWIVCRIAGCDAGGTCDFDQLQPGARTAAPCRTERSAVGTLYLTVLVGASAAPISEHPQAAQADN
jgi:hypothetical protein